MSTRWLLGAKSPSFAIMAHTGNDQLVVNVAALQGCIFSKSSCWGPGIMIYVDT